jgi:hypothetical protein
MAEIRNTVNQFKSLTSQLKKRTSEPVPEQSTGNDYDVAATVDTSVDADAEALSQPADDTLDDKVDVDLDKDTNTADDLALARNGLDTTPDAEHIEMICEELYGLVDEPVALEAKIKYWSKKLGVKKRSVEDQFDKWCTANIETVPSGGPDELDTPVWDEPVDGLEVFKQLLSGIKDQVIIEERHAVMLALWIMASHKYQCYMQFPFLNIKGEFGGGKSAANNAIRNFGFRVTTVYNTTAANIFRGIEEKGPGVRLYDEINRFLHDVEMVSSPNSRVEGYLNYITA